ncbi:hypothetical protein [Mariniflexile sp. AS56]|uniref:hypothetical protein n=1 Tax=Mariniflexile sp. AS56 TaxID=3063957 RepID=UPI0026E98C64|nr:hypothetical protein [Mariniflexile sp. AS56]MDO7174036.1 hypothetical protein [Mariniflexile sp. AS56]
MKNYAPIIAKLEEELEHLEANSENIVDIAESAIILIKKALEDSRHIVVKSKFSSKVDEI